MVHRAVATCVGVVLVTALSASSTSPTSAATPTPTPTATQTATVTVTPAPATATPISDLGLNIDTVLGLITPPAYVRWRLVGPGVSYRLTGQITMVRANAAEPFCAEPLVHERERSK